MAAAAASSPVYRRLLERVQCDWNHAPAGVIEHMMYLRTGVFSRYISDLERRGLVTPTRLQQLLEISEMAGRWASAAMISAHLADAKHPFPLPAAADPTRTRPNPVRCECGSATICLLHDPRGDMANYVVCECGSGATACIEHDLTRLACETSVKQPADAWGDMETSGKRLAIDDPPSVTCECGGLTCIAARRVPAYCATTAAMSPQYSVADVLCGNML